MRLILTDNRKVFMTLDQIRKAVNDGLTVHWANESYIVTKSKYGVYLICNKWNDSCTGLTWLDGVTMNEKEDQFFISKGVN